MKIKDQVDFYSMLCMYICIMYIFKIQLYMGLLMYNLQNL